MLLPLAAAILVGGVLAVYYAAFRGDDGSEANETASAPSRASQAQSEIRAARSSLTESLNDKREGISVRWPQSWRQTARAGVHRIESRDHCMTITLAAPASTGDAGRVRRDALGILRSSFKRVRVEPGEKGKQIGGIPTENDVITVRNQDGDLVRVLLGVGRGKTNAYLSEVVLRNPSCGQALLEAQLILQSARFTR